MTTKQHQQQQHAQQVQLENKRKYAGKERVYDNSEGREKEGRN